MAADADADMVEHLIQHFLQLVFGPPVFHDDGMHIELLLELIDLPPLGAEIGVIFPETLHLFKIHLQPCELIYKSSHFLILFEECPVFAIMPVGFSLPYLFI